MVTIKSPRLHKLIKGFDQMPRKIQRYVLKALNQAGSMIVDYAAFNYTPRDTGALRASRFVIADNQGVKLGFGGVSAPYAKVVHNHPSSLSPASWQGKAIKWSVPGTGPGFLKRAIKEKHKEFIEKYRERYEAQLWRMF